MFNDVLSSLLVLQVTIETYSVTQTSLGILLHARVNEKIE